MPIAIQVDFAGFRWTVGIGRSFADGLLDGWLLRLFGLARSRPDLLMLRLRNVVAASDQQGDRTNNGEETQSNCGHSPLTVSRPLSFTYPSLLSGSGRLRPGTL